MFQIGNSSGTPDMMIRNTIHNSVAQSQTNRYDRGFTLIEIALALSIGAAVVLIASEAFMLVTHAREKSEAMLVLREEGGQMLETMTRSIRNADGVIVPLWREPATSLTLHTLDPATDPTIINLEQETVWMTEGAQLHTPLSNSHVRVETFTVEDVSYAGTPPLVLITLVLHYKNPNPELPDLFTLTLHTAAQVRH